MKREFEVGDLCRIRSWDDMAAEFGLYDTGNIKCDFTFTTGMRPLCGMEFEVLDYDYNSTGRRIYHTNDSLFNPWKISGDMLELVDRRDAAPLAPLPPIGDLLW